MRKPRNGVPRSHQVVEAGVGLVLAVALGLTACSGGSSEPSADPDDGGGTEAIEGPAPVKTVSSMGKISGKLDEDRRSRVRQQVAQAVDAWFEAAFVGGDYPRNDFADSWPGFTTGAKARAKAAKALMSNQDIGQQISGVEATARKVTVDVLAVKGRAVGATARVVLKFTTEGDVAKSFEVRGRLFLTQSDSGWRIFGYDVTKGDVA